MSESNDATITELLKNVEQALNFDDLFIMAGALNLYIESMQRLSNRSLVGPKDMEHILTIWNIYRMVANVQEDRIPGAPTKNLRPVT
jgi:hypothetical protein